jgi:hypothetical protein
MSSVFDVLGLDAEDLEWQDLALCEGQEISRFHEGYESSPRIAKQTDQMCLSCPVQRMCLQAGIENNEYGTWGGVYLTNGKVDEAKNSHKTQDIWEQIREGLT